MLSIENKVFTTLASALRSAYPGIAVYGDYIEAAESFPCVSIVESNNTVASQFTSNTELEHASDVTYDINVYSNKQGTKKTEAKNIADTVDAVMSGMNFARRSRLQVPNIDRTVYRINMRYDGRITQVISGGNILVAVHRKPQ